DVKSVVGRPVPVEQLAVRRLPVPAPLDLAPEPGDGVADLAFHRVVAVEVLPGGEQALDHERGLDEVAAVVVLAEVGIDPARVAVEEMRPHAMEAVRLREPAYDLQHALCDR